MIRILVNQPIHSSAPCIPIKSLYATIPGDVAGERAWCTDAGQVILTDIHISIHDAWDRVEQAYDRYEVVSQHRALSDPALSPYRKEYMQALAVFQALLHQMSVPFPQVPPMEE